MPFNSITLNYFTALLFVSFGFEVKSLAPPKPLNTFRCIEQRALPRFGTCEGGSTSATASKNQLPGLLHFLGLASQLCRTLPNVGTIMIVKRDINSESS